MKTMLVLTCLLLEIGFSSFVQADSVKRSCPYGHHWAKYEGVDGFSICVPNCPVGTTYISGKCVGIPDCNGPCSPYPGSENISMKRTSAESTSYACVLGQGSSSISSFRFIQTDQAYYFDEAPLRPLGREYMSSAKFPGARIQFARTADPRSPGAVVWLHYASDTTIGYSCQ
jgi:hypothetical protein